MKYVRLSHIMQSRRILGLWTRQCSQLRISLLYHYPCHYDGVSINYVTGAAICTVLVVGRRNGRFLVVAYLGSHCTKLNAVEWKCWCFMSSVWPDSISRWIGRRNILCKSRTKGRELTSVRGRKHETYTKSPNTSRPEKARQVKRMLIICFDINGTGRKEFVLAGQLVT
jgi:hypothetical protein